MRIFEESESSTAPLPGDFVVRPAWVPLSERRVRCNRCGYEWETKSKLRNVTCPSCHYKVDSIKWEVARI